MLLGNPAQEIQEAGQGRDTTAVAEQRFAKSLRLLDDYRGGLGARLRQTSQDIIEGEFQEETPPNTAADVSSMSPAASGEALRLEQASVPQAPITDPMNTPASEHISARVPQDGDLPVSSNDPEPKAG